MEEQDTKTKKFAEKWMQPFPPQFMIGYAFLLGIMTNYAPQYLQIKNDQFTTVTNFIALLLFLAAIYLFVKIYKISLYEHGLHIIFIFSIFTCPVAYILAYDFDHGGDHYMALNLRIMSYLCILIILTAMPIYLAFFLNFIKTKKIGISAILGKIPAIITSVTLITTLIIQVIQIASSIFHF